MSVLLETVYGKISADIFARAKLVRLLICDVDGVLSNGLIYRDSRGEELKSYHVHDGHGIRALLGAGIEIAIITGGASRMVTDRTATLGIKHVYQGQQDKIVPFRELLEKLGIQPSQAAYMGDDCVDLPVMACVGLSIAVANAHPSVLQKADYVTCKLGGYGAVREVCDLILMAQDRLDQEGFNS